MYLHTPYCYLKKMTANDHFKLNVVLQLELDIKVNSIVDLGTHNIVDSNGNPKKERRFEVELGLIQPGDPNHTIQHESIDFQRNGEDRYTVKVKRAAGTTGGNPDGGGSGDFD